MPPFRPPAWWQTRSRLRSARTAQRRIVCEPSPIAAEVLEDRTLLSGSSIWISTDQLMALPTSGDAWENVLEASQRDISTPDISDQDDDTDVNTLARALVGVRLGDETLQAEVRTTILAAMGTEDEGRTLALGRNLAAYVIAADLVGLDSADDAAFRDWLRETIHEDLSGRTLVSTHEDRANNWGTMAGGSLAAVGAYLDDRVLLDRTAQVFRGWLGDRDSYAGFNFGDDLSWQADPFNPVGVNPIGATKDGQNIDGAIPEDMRRGGPFQFPPIETNYPWGALEGAVMQAELLQRAGYDTWQWEDQALRRATDYLYVELEWFPDNDDESIPWLVNANYGTNYAAVDDANPGEMLGWTSWTHQFGLAGEENQPPIVNAGPDQSAVIDDDVLLNGTVYDDGLPPAPATVTFNWELVDGPGTALFADASSIDTTVQFDTTGTYTLRLTAHDGEFFASDETTITINNVSSLQTVSYQDGFSPTSGYSGTIDTTIKSRKPDNNYGDRDEVDIDGSPDTAALIRWQLDVPAGSQVHAASIRLSIANKSDDVYEIYQVLRPWVESAATWNSADGVSAWELPGAQGSSDRGSTALGEILAPEEGLLTIDLNAEGVAAVQSWVDDPSLNYGLVFQDYHEASNGADFDSSEAVQAHLRPTLSVTYSSPDVAIPNEPPVADAGGPYFADEGMLILFDASGSFDPDVDMLTYRWDFGDGSQPVSTTAPQVSHNYRWGGNFTVELTVTDSRGESSTDTVTAAIVEINDVPVADLGNDYEGIVGQAIAFDATDSYDPDNEDGTAVNDRPLTYHWEFGDGSQLTTTTATVSHAYAQEGAYIVTLVVSDGILSGTTQVSATASPANVAPTVTTTAAPLAYQENAPGVSIDAGLTAVDPDNGVLNGATVAITSGFAAGEDLLTFVDQNGITGSYNAAAGVLTLSGTSGDASYQAALRSVTYQNTSDAPSEAERTLTITVSDGQADASAQRAINVVAVNDAPQVTASQSPIDYTENDPATAIDPALTVGDLDDAQLTGASVAISAGFAAGEDVLAFVDQNGITGNYDALTGLLTLSGTATTAQYQQALRSVTYQNTSEDPTGGDRTVTFTATDGIDSGSGQRLVAVAPVNDAPVVTTDPASLTYVENDPPTAIDPELTIVDLDDSELTDATVAIGAGFFIGEDVLSFTDQTGITGSYDAGTGMLTLSGTATVAEYQAALQSVTYENSSADPTAGPRTVTFTVGDGADGGGAQRIIDVAAFNAAPEVTTTIGPLAYAENSGPVAVDPSLSVSDVDSAELTAASVAFAAGFQSGADLLAFVDQNGIAGSYDAALGLLTLSGTASVADYQAALRSVTYENTSDDPTTVPRTLTFSVSDELSSADGQRTIELTAVNDAPTVTVTAAVLNYNENDPAAAVDAALALVDPDSQTLTGAAVSITSAFAAGEDLLAFTDQSGIAGNYNAASGVLTLSGTASVTDYEAALRSVTYENTSDVPTEGTRTIHFEVSDGSDAGGGQRIVDVAAANDVPTVSTTALPLSYQENDTATPIDPALTLADADNAELVGATITIAAGFAPAEDLLAFVDQNGITGSYDAAIGVLTLSGVASVAHYQTALQSVTYQNASDDPGDADRTIEFTVDDGTNSGSGQRTIDVTAVNDVPVIITNPSDLEYTENDPQTAIDPGLSLSDLDNPQLTGAAVAVTAGFVPGEDVLGFVDQNGISGGYDAGAGVLTLSGTASVADYETALRSVAYQNSSDNPAAAQRTLSFTVSDGAGSGSGQRNVTVTAVNDDPISQGIADVSVLANAADTVIDLHTAFNDLDHADAELSFAVTANSDPGLFDSVTIDQAAGTLTLDYAAGAAGTSDMTLTATDPLGGSAEASFSVTISNQVVTTTFRDGVNGYAGTRDTMIQQRNADRNYGSNNELKVDGSPDRATLLAWDVSAISPGNLVQSASITVSVTNKTDDLYDIYEVLSTWTESEVTWNEAASGIAWEQAGVQGTADRGTTSVGEFIAPDEGLLTIELNAAGVALVQSWIDNPSQNHGIILQNYDSASNGGEIESREAGDVADRPGLSVTYLPGAPEEPQENEAPVVTATAAALDYTENDPATAVDAGLSLSDADDPFLSGATVSISAGFAAGEDLLHFTDQNGISGSYNAATGLLTLSGSSTVSAYETALRSVTYENTSEQPTETQRTVTFIVDDGTETGQAARNLSVASVNDTPTAVEIDDLLVGVDSPDTEIDLQTVFADTEDAAADMEFLVTGNTDQVLVSTSIDDAADTLTLSYTPGASGSAEITLRATDSGGEFVETTLQVTVLESAGPATATFQDGVSHGGAYDGTEDTYIRGDDPDKASPGSSIMKVDGNPDMAALIRWDIASTLSAGDSVVSASITLNVPNDSDAAFDLFEMLVPWVEAEATFNQFANGANWETAGAQGAGDRGSTALGSVTPTSGLVTIDLNAAGLAVVQSWIDDPSANNGLAILNYDDNASDQARFSSSDTGTAGQRPQLSVTYIPSGGQNLLAAGGAVDGTSTSLTGEELSPLVDEAAERLIAAVPLLERAAVAAALENVTVEITDLSGALLGRAGDGVIQIDVDAAGYGWFVDSTPSDDSEFGTDGRANESGAADGQIDLLSVIAHELGHILGRGHTDGGLMDETLESGVRTSLQGGPADHESGGESSAAEHDAVSLLDRAFSQFGSDWSA